MFAIGALAIGIVCGWLSVLIGGRSNSVLSAGIFLIFIVLGLIVADPVAFKPIVLGAFIGLTLHVMWLRHLAATVQARGKSNNDIDG
jgi:hypothetical protein